MSLSSQINKQDIISAADQCVMCGLCLPHCPTYAVAKSEPESPRGRIALVRALYEGKLAPNENIHAHLDHCLTCTSCEQACPANVDYEKIIDAGRTLTSQQSGKFTQLQQSLWLLTLSNPFLRKLTKKMLATLQITKLSRLFGRLRAIKLLPSIASTQSTLQNVSHENSNNINLWIFNSCAGDLVDDPVNIEAKRILSKLGYSIINNKHNHCCGALHQHSGQIAKAHALREKLIQSFKHHQPDHVLSLATGCGAQIKRYSQLTNSPAASEFASKLVDINDFILENIVKSDITFKPFPHKVFLHKPCSLNDASTHADAIDECLKLIPEINVVNFQDTLTCCGAGGMNTLTHETLADTLIKNKVNELKESNAEYLVSSNIGCALHFQANLKSQNIPVQVCHPITLLAKQML